MSKWPVLGQSCVDVADAVFGQAEGGVGKRGQHVFGGEISLVAALFLARQILGMLPGMFHPLPFLNEGFVTDLDNFTLVLYTDGLTETENEEEEEYGSERIEEYLEKNKDKDLRDLHKELLEELDVFK